MTRTKINRRLARLIDQCNVLLHVGKLTDEQKAYTNQLMAWAGQFVARCKLNPFRTIGLSEPTDNMLDIEETARQRLERVGKTRLIALDLERFPATCALAEFLEHRISLDLQALRVAHEAGQLARYVQWHRSRWSGALADLVPSLSATPPRVQAETDGMRPFGAKCSDWS